MFQSSPPREPESFDDTPFAWIETQEGLNSLIEDLAGVTELAIDLEHHDYRSFSGFLCLMQISTRSKDYVIDTLLLREELEVLNQFFADPNVVTVCPSKFPYTMLVPIIVNLLAAGLSRCPE